MSTPKTVPIKDVLEVASKGPLLAFGAMPIGNYKLVSSNNRAAIDVAVVTANHTGLAETKANAMLLTHCRNTFVYLTSILDRLSKKAKQINEAQRAGLTIAPEDWADLHQLQLEANATLEIASNVKAPE